jgi:hypothetical protein
MGQSEIYAAFVLAQRAFPEIEKDSKADVGKYTYKYASLPAIQRAVFPVLHEAGIAVTQLFQGDSLETRLIHGSGEYMTSLLDCSDTGLNPQDFGKKITYYRRYALCAALGIAPDEDVDALGVDVPATKKPAPDPPPPKAVKTLSGDDWTSHIPDDIVDIVKENFQIIENREHDAHEWHQKVLKNWLDIRVKEDQSVVGVIKGLEREQLAELAKLQNDRIKMNKGD